MVFHYTTTTMLNNKNDCADHYHMQWHEHTASQGLMVLTNDNKCDNDNSSSSVFTR